MINNEHLELEELLNFSTIDDLSNENKELAAKVYKHLRSCAACRRVLGGINDFHYSLEKESKTEYYGRSLASAKSPRSKKGDKCAFLLGDEE